MKERAVGGTRNTRSRVLSVYPSPQDVVLFLSVRRERVIFLATLWRSSSRRPSLTHSSRSLFSLTTLLAHSSRSLLSFHSGASSIRRPEHLPLRRRRHARLYPDIRLRRRWARRRAGGAHRRGRGSGGGRGGGGGGMVLMVRGGTRSRCVDGYSAYVLRTPVPHHIPIPPLPHNPIPPLRHYATPPLPHIIPTLPLNTPLITPLIDPLITPRTPARTPDRTTTR